MLHSQKSRQSSGGEAARAGRGWTLLLPGLILLAAGLIAGLVWLQNCRLVAKWDEHVATENRLRFASSREHTLDYFDSIHSTLLFISLDKHVQGLGRASHDFIEALFQHQWEHHRLTEVYITPKDFTGEGRPFMTFERAAHGMTLGAVHAHQREQEEYQTISSHIRLFQEDPSRQAVLSREIRLCEPDSQGGQARGFVLSVPIRSLGELVGVVSGMFQTETLYKVLQQGLSQETTFLINERGQLLGQGRVFEEVRPWFEQQFTQRTPAETLAAAPESLAINEATVLWMPVEIVPSERWWLAFVFDKESYQEQRAFLGPWEVGMTLGSVLFAGGALAVSVRLMGLRIREQARHWQERKLLERQIQDASEREQRRVGILLREDLCQRLTGIEAVSQVLKKRLQGGQLPEAQVAAEIARETSESLSNARALADALQPVSMLQHGFLAALEELALRLQQKSGIRCRVETTEFPEELDLSVATHLYRIAQEALHNSLQHAQAKEIVLGLSARLSQVTLTIRDDGIGIPAGALEGPGLGLRLMRYRSELIGGRLDLRTAPNQGTVVTCSCPTPEAETPLAK